MPKAIKKRVARETKTEEDVKTLIHGVRESIAERQKFLLPVFVAAVVVIIAVAGFFIYRSSMNKKADAFEYEAYQIYYGLQQRQPLERGAQYQKALDVFKKAYETRKSAFSLFYIANSYYNMAKYDDALKALKELNERFPGDERFVPLSYYKMAVINLRKGDRDSALKLLDALYNYKTDSFKDLALAESARILESMGRADEAAKKHAELKKNYPNSPFIKTAQTQAGEKKN